MSEFDVYLWTRLDPIDFVISLIAWTYWHACIVASVWICVKKNNDEEVNFNLSVFWLGFIFVAFVSCLFPTSKEYAMIKVIPKMANSELATQIQKDVPELYQIAMSALKEKIIPKKA